MPSIWNRRRAPRPPRVFAAAAVVAALAGCHAGNGPGPAAPSAGYAVTERAESGPITALAVKSPFVWAAGVPGLRRFDVTTGEYEAVGEPNDARTRAITAIAIDDDGAAWVAGAMGIGRWVAAGDDLRYEPKGTPGMITALVARRPVATEGLWAGGPGGLYRYDGRIFPSIDGIRDVPVSSIVLDDDGKSAWVGTHKHGLYHAEGDHAAPVPGGEAIFLDAVLGVGKTAAGTRLVAGNAGGEARLYALTKAGVEGFHAGQGTVVVALVDRSGDAVLIAGPPGKPQPYTVRPLAPGEAWPPGSLRFSSLVPERPARWAGMPTAERLPPDVTLAAATGKDLYVGSARMGVARAAPDAPRYVVGSQLVGDARRLFVACASAARCTVVTDAPRAWLTDGDSYQPTRLGEPEAATPIALASDGQGTVYAVSREPETRGLVITRLPAGLRAPVETDWQPLHKVALELPPKTTPTASFAAVSGANTLWLGLRVTGDDDGSDVGYGAVEIELGNGHAVQHRPRRANEKVPPEALPLPSSLTGILFDKGATYYASLSGIGRWQEGQLRSWNENEGLASESVHAIGRGSDGAIWAATSAGVARFDGQNWRPLGGELAARGLATDGKGRLWVATAKGLRALPPGEAAAGVDPAATPVVLAGDMRDVAVDRLGRIWAMSTTSVALVQEK